MHGPCKHCRSGRTNLCRVIRTTQGKGLMPDGTSRFTVGGNTLYHFMGTSTFSEYTVCPEISVAKVRRAHGRILPLCKMPALCGMRAVGGVLC